MVNRFKLVALMITLITIISLAACGQKRALYLPEEPVSNNTERDSEITPDTTEQGNN